MRYELRRLDAIGVEIGNHPNHYIRHLAVSDEIIKNAPREILILGCGKGLVEYTLPSGMHCMSIDVSPEEIEIAKQINRHKPNRSFSVFNIYDVPNVINGSRFDLVSISEVIEHLPDDGAALRIARSALKPDGRLVLTVPNDYRFQNRVLRWRGRETSFMDADHKREYTIQAIRALVREAGLEIIRWRGVYFSFPRPFVVERFVSPYSRLHRLLSWLIPSCATYLLITCRCAG